MLQSGDVSGLAGAADWPGKQPDGNGCAEGIQHNIC